MVIILSPAKTLRSDKITHPAPTPPIFPEKTASLMQTLKALSKNELKNLMKISDKLTDLNYVRNQAFDSDLEILRGDPAIYTFMGDVYQGLEADTWEENDLKYAETRLFILSGLYGLLRPSTLVQPYRLEMGISLKTKKTENLYDFWGNDLTALLQKALDDQENKILINLASNEYAKAVHFKELKADIIDIQFREWRNEEWKFISFNAKKARGLMARYIIMNGVEDIETLKGFHLGGYGYNEEMSSAKELCFTR